MSKVFFFTAIKTVLMLGLRLVKRAWQYTSAVGYIDSENVKINV